LQVGAAESELSLTVTAVSVVAPLVSASKTISVVPSAVVRTAAGLYINDSTEPVDMSSYTTPSPETWDNLLGKAMAYIKANAVTGTVYTIVLDSDISGNRTINLDSVATNNVQTVAITLEGLSVERTISRLNDTGSTFVINAAGVTLTLGNNITLRGRTSGVGVHTGNNLSDVVTVTQGKLVMLDGSKITGNTNTVSSNYQAAGVTVNSNATFEMRGGEISGNTRTAGTRAAGGVFNRGTFIMSDGIIRGNTVNSSGNYCAGGVVNNSATTTFEKTGGIIYGVNTDRGGYNAADDNSAEGTSGATKANAVLWQDSSKAWHPIDDDVTGDFPTE
jgi:hypothetical protein